MHALLQHHYSQQRAADLRAEAQREQLARLAQSAPRPTLRLNLRPLLVRLKLA